jgi:hypothetical protein
MHFSQYEASSCCAPRNGGTRGGARFQAIIEQMAFTAIDDAKSRER